MTLGDAIRKAASDLAGIHLYRKLPRGVDFMVDVKRFLPKCDLKTIFDVGANVGELAGRFARSFPEARILCFEPVSATFHKLQASVQACRRVECYPLALGSRRGKGKMVLLGAPDNYSLREPDQAAPGTEQPFEEVQVETLDAFCQDQQIPRIDYLKVDAEGADLDVLKGGEGLLQAQQIDLVEVEAGMNRRNRKHVPIELVKEHLESRNYFLFGIYEQVREWPAREPHLRRANPVFISGTRHKNERPGEAVTQWRSRRSDGVME